MSLESFKKPASVTFEVEGERFVIELPTRWNKQYTRSWQKVMTDNTIVDETGRVKVNVNDPSILVDAQFEAFVDFCFISSPLSSEELRGDYLPLTEALFDAANKLANEEEARAEALVGKLSTGSSGTEDGKDKLNSTISLNETVESQPRI